jgi:hypothetical protein
MTTVNQQQDKLVAAALRRLDVLDRREAFDPNVSGSKPTEIQLEVIREFGTVRHQYIRAGSQGGKTTTCAFNVAKALVGQHPYWKRPESWGDEPLLVLVAGRNSKQIEESLLPRLRSYLEPGTYKEVRIGAILQRLEIIAGPGAGNRVVFQSLENPHQARERLQSYTAHIAWLDELPPIVEIIAEMHRAVQARSGMFMASFTPLARSIEVQKLVDSTQLPLSKVYRFRMLDNPVYADPAKQAEILQGLSTLSEAQRNSRLFGEWMSTDDQVYYFNWSMVEMPENYSPMWRHVEVVDPALKSALGLTIWAERPDTGIWYCVHAEKIRGIYVPTDLVNAVRERTKSYNIIRRRSDPHEVWYIQTASSMGITYEGVYKKNERKAELIKGLQEKLGSKVRIAPHCTELIEELQECRWSDQAEGKIVNASSYHLLDTAQYFCDSIPKADNTKIESASWHEWLYKANEQRKASERKKKQKAERMVIRNRRARWR